MNVADRVHLHVQNKARQNSAAQQGDNEEKKFNDGPRINSTSTGETDPVVVEDVSKDKRFANDNFLKARGIQSYIAAPLRTESGHADALDRSTYATGGLRVHPGHHERRNPIRFNRRALLFSTRG